MSVSIFKWPVPQPDSFVQVDFDTGTDYFHKIRPVRCFINKYVIQDLLKMPIYGVKDVSTKEYQRDNCGICNILVSGGSLGELCSLPFVDEARSLSTCVHQINQWLGIAATSINSVVSLVMMLIKAIIGLLHLS